MSTRTRTRTVTVDLDASAQHCRNHYAKRRKAGDRQRTIWLTPDADRHLQAIAAYYQTTLEKAVTYALLQTYKALP